MDNNHSDKVKSVFLAAIERCGPERAAYLDGACGGDAELRGRVEELLVAHEQMGSFHEQQDPAGVPTADFAPIAEAPGTTIGRYKLLQKIGEGGFGVVFMAEQREPVVRKVALKIIKPGMDTREVIARFEAERQALALMDHPNIARVLDAGSIDSGRPFFVMELVKGVPITDFCDRNELPAEERLKLFAAICHAVQHAHQKGIIHRDIKPSNILVTLHDGQPVPKVIDFGVSKAISQRLTEKTLFTAYGQMIGTPQYMSPEQAEMSGLDVDTRSDVYSLGVLLYELLTGTTPLEGERLRTAGYAEMQRMIREEDPPRPSVRLNGLGEQLTAIAKQRSTDARRLQQTIRGELDWIAMKCLEKERGRRYGSANSLAEDVERFLSGEPVEAHPPSTAYRLRKFMRRYRFPVAVTAAIVAALLAAVVGTTAGMVRAARFAADREQALQELQATLRGLQDELFNKAVTAALGAGPERAHQAIDEAEAAGVPESKLEVLRGLLDYYSGNMDGSVGHLENAVTIAPHSYAARALLAWVSATAGDSERCTEALVALERLTPITAEDYLFKALLEQSTEPDKSLASIAKAIDLRNSPIAHVVKAAAIMHLAHRRKDMELARQAIQETMAAKTFIPENSLALGIELCVYHAAFRIARLNGNQSDAASLLAKANILADQIPETPTPLVARAWFYADTGRADRVLSEWRSRFAAGEKAFEFCDIAPLFFQCRRSKELSAIIDRQPESRDPLTQLARVLVMIEDDRSREQASDQCEKLISQHNAVDVRLGALGVFLLLGEYDKAQQWATEFRSTSSPPSRWLNLNYESHIGFIAGAVAEEKYVREASLGAHYHIGLVALARGSRDEARKQFRQQVDGPIHDHWSGWARGFLDRMENDPKWPRWIEPSRTRP
jgi:tetratricopeptide (TPR) repeat protein